MPGLSRRLGGHGGGSILRLQRGRVALSILRCLLPVSLLATAISLLVATAHLEAFSTSPFPIANPPRFNPGLALHLAAPGSHLPTGRMAAVPLDLTLHRGETLGEVFDGLGLDADDSHAAIEALSEYLDVRHLPAGQSYSVLLRPNSTPSGFEFTLAGRGRVDVARGGGGGWTASFTPFERQLVTRCVRGSLEGSLVGSIEKAGAPAGLAYRMADVLQWDLDFNRDLRLGDRFEVVYQVLYLDGEPSSLGPILALDYRNAGRRLQAFRYGHDGGYYDAEGRPLQKMFLRSPLRFSRITSRFSRHRFHPILKRFRPHYGVDFGAPVGTPVRVTANGTVTFAGWDRGGGRTIKVRHPNGYLTAYLHLSRFARGIRPGARVHQGEVIGFVGQTGLATGPHLDYRVQRGGRWIDPLSLKSVPADPIPKRHLAAFEALRDALLASLASGVPPRALPAREALAEAGAAPSASSEGSGSVSSAAR